MQTVEKAMDGFFNRLLGHLLNPAVSASPYPGVGWPDLLQVVIMVVKRPGNESISHPIFV
jgi:hypothetical protein